MKYLKYLMAAAVWLTAAAVLAGEMQPFAFPFVGRWNPSEHPMLLDDYGLQDIQNLRKSGKHFKGVKGHTKINSTALSDLYVINGFHFRKDQPQESHMIVYAGNSVTPSAGHIYQNTAGIPGAANFDSTVLYSPSNFTGTFRFSNAPNGNMLATNGAEMLIWGGNEIPVTAFLTSSADYISTLTNSMDYSEALADPSADTSTNNVATLTAGSSNYFIIGSRRPLKGVKFYISSGNAATSSLTVKTWTSNGWSAITATDNTSVGGKTLAQTGTVTWASTVGTSKQRYINGLSLYWYGFYFSAGSASMYYVTVDAPIQPVCNIWDGAEVKVSRFTFYQSTNTAYLDYTSEVGDSDDNTYAEKITGMSTNSYILLGFTQPMQGFDVRIPATKENVNTITLSVKYWNGSDWTSVVGLTDGTYSDSKSFHGNGIISFRQIAAGSEFTTTIGDTVPLYYYKLSFSGIPSDPFYISEVRGIPVPRKMTAYKSGAVFQNRLFLLNETNGRKNRAVYSAYNSPDIWNGEDSGELYFGDDTELVAAAPIYNIFNSSGGLEQLIVAKKNETYRVTGSKPSDWSVQRISTNVGCVAPLTMVSADVTAVDNARRQVALWVSDKGVYMTDGASVIPVSDDIKCYFDSNDVRCIPAAMQSKSFGWYDPSTRSYKLLIASGAGATYLNTELEYSLQYQEWTKIYREDASGANPLQSGWQVYDVSGVGYTYGGSKNGYVYRLENTNSWDGTNIAQYLQTKDLLLDQAAPLLRKSTVDYIQLAYRKKQTGQITVRHFGDGAETYDGVDGQAGPYNITAAEASAYPYNTQSVLLGPHLFHSFRFQAATNVEDGMELTGMALYHEPYTAIR